MATKPKAIDLEDFWRLSHRIREGKPLPEPARDWLIELLDLVRHGEDPREFAGTMPPPGRPSKPRAIVGVHYWALRKKYGKALPARREVMATWELSESRVKAIARASREAFWPGINHMDAGELAELLAGIEAEGS